MLFRSPVRTTIAAAGGIPGNAPGSRNRRPNGRLVAEAALKDFVHPGVVLQVVQVDVALEDLVHGRARAFQLLADLVEHSLGVDLDVARFVPLPEFHKQVAGLFSFVKSAPLAQGSKEILIPGEPEARISRERSAGGVPIDDETWRQITACAAEVGVDA